MDILVKVLLVLHFVGLASILGGVLVQTKLFRSGARVLPAIMHGAWLQLITGLALTGVISATDSDLNNTKIAVKLGVLIVIIVLAFINRSPSFFTAMRDPIDAARKKHGAGFGGVDSSCKSLTGDQIDKIDRLRVNCEKLIDAAAKK